MKKVLLFLVFLLAFMSPVLAQETENMQDKAEADSEVSGEFLQQYQTFSWKKIAKAKKYEIEIEKELSEENWELSVSEQTTDNHIEILLYPGHYRVAISVFNALGRKTSTTDWTPFIILNETQPYLYADSLKKSDAWQTPLLTLKPEGTTTVEEVDDEGSVTSREGDPQNSFFLKGKNIFFPETKFSLVPKDTATEGRQFDALVDIRNEVPLEIVRRDTENGGVVVTYDPNVLFSGYYDIVAKNPGGQSASLELLVFYNGAPQFDTSIYQYNEYYKVSSLSVFKSGQVSIPVHGKGFGSNTTFTLTPDNGFIPYPFTSEFKRVDIDIEMTEHKSLDDQGNLALTFSFPSDQIYTGYYKLTASNGGLSESSILLLVQANGPASSAPEVSKMQTKPDKGTKQITYQVFGNNINGNTKFSLVSTYSETSDSNTRFEVSYVKSKRRGTLHILTGEGKGVEPGIYAILMENENSSQIIYVEVNEKQDFSLANISNTEAEKFFFRPPAKIAKNTVTLEEDFTYNMLKSRTFTGFKTILPSFHVIGAINTGFNYQNYDEQISIDLLYLKWFRLSAGVDFFEFPNYGYNGYAFGGEAYLEIPINNFQPFIGAGYYYPYSVTPTSKNTPWTRTPYMPISVGARFGTLLEFQYTLYLENFGTDKCFAQDRFGLGIVLPIRGMRYTRTPLEYESKITSNEPIGSESYKLKGKTTALNLNAETIIGFAGNKKINTLYFGSEVRTIAKGAFKDCTSLSSVKLSDHLEVIEKEAFANVTNISLLKIPNSIKTIENDAFAGWNTNQVIELQWSSDDETIRNLEGLKNSDCTVLYKDGIPFTTNSNFVSKFLSSSNWTMVNTNPYDKPVLYNTTLDTKDKKTHYTFSLYSQIIVKDDNVYATKFSLKKELLEEIRNECNNNHAKGLKLNLSGSNLDKSEVSITIQTTLDSKVYVLDQTQKTNIPLEFQPDEYISNIIITVQPLKNVSSQLYKQYENQTYNMHLFDIGLYY